MSYCRFSSDDHACDVYVYGNMWGGITIHVASYRIVPIRPLPPKLGKWWLDGLAGIDAFVARNDEVHDIIAKSPKDKISLPHAGQTFDLPTPKEAAEALEELRTLGYRIPDGVIEALREEETNEC